VAELQATVQWRISSVLAAYFRLEVPIAMFNILFIWAAYTPITARRHWDSWLDVSGFSNVEGRHRVKGCPLCWIPLTGV
jgi:hypothetical protein